MQLSNIPGKLVLPFANAGGKSTIPVASQIGITAGAASLTDGFPPLTRTPIAAGGVPPSGLDMNGVLYEMSNIVRWANAGGGYPYDGAFVTDANVGGYPKGARVMRSDGQGYWLNTTENNVTDPEGAGAVAAGWVPDYSYGAAAVTMTSANVTLTPAQWGKPVIVITGLLTADLNLVFPNIVGRWQVINSTTGAFAITAKTAAGTGVVTVRGYSDIVASDGVDVRSATDKYSAPSGASLVGYMPAGVGAVPRTVQDKARLTVDAKDYATGDGVTDDAPKLEALSLAVYNAGGGTIRLNAGMYLLGTLSSDANSYSSYITARDGVNWVGDGIGVSILKVASGQNLVYKTLNKPYIIATQQTGLLTNSSMRDFTVDWNGSNNLLDATYTARNNCALFTRYGAKNVVVERLEVKNTPGNQCIYIKNETYNTNPGTGVVVRDCLFTNNGGGLIGNYCTDHSSVYISCDDVLIENNTFRSDVAPGMVYGVTAYEMHGSRNVARNNRGVNYTRPCYIGSDYGILNDISVYGDQFTGLVSGPSVTAQVYAINDVRILNSTYRQAAGLTYTGTTFFVNGNTIIGCDSMIVKGCKFYGQNYANSSFMQHYKINNFEFTDNYVESFGDATVYGIQFSGVVTSGSNIANTVTIERNTFKDVDVAIYLNQVTKIIDLLSIRDNKFYRSSVDAAAAVTCVLSSAIGQISGNTWNSNYTAAPVIVSTIISGGLKVLDQFKGSATYDPPSIAAAGQATTTVTCSGARAGDYVTASFSNSLAGITLSGYVSAVNTVTAVFQNGTAGAVDLASGTLSVAANRLN